MSRIPSSLLYKISTPSKSLIHNFRLRKTLNCSGGFGFQHNRSFLTTTCLATDKISSTGQSNFSFIEYFQQNATFSPASSGTIFSDTGPVLYFVDFLCFLKDLDDLSWVQVILCSTVVIRIALGLPIAITQQRAIARLEKLKPELEDLALELRKETGLAIRQFKWDEKTAKRQYKKSFKKHWRKFMEDHNCHPMRSLCLGLLQVPVWICFSSALRNIVFALPLPRTEGIAMRWFEIHQEGLPWVANLTMSDPYILPVIFLVSNVANIWVHTSRNKGLPLTPMQRSLPWVFTGVIVCISGFACFVPAGVTMYWATSSSVALAQNLVLLHPGLRHRLKMPIYSKSPPSAGPSSPQPT